MALAKPQNPEKTAKKNRSKHAFVSSVPKDKERDLKISIKNNVLQR